MSDGVRMPRLLDANLQEARRLRPTALSLNLNRRAVSTAQITLPGEDEALPLMGFVEMYLRRGSAGIFRVQETSQAAKGSNTRTYALSHAVSTLHDSVWRAQEDFSGTVIAFLTQLLSYQQTARWQLGTVQDTSQWKKSGINYDHLDTLLYELAADRKDYLLTFDFSTSPWTLNFVQASGQVDCEMRRTRNLSDAQARGSLEGMCNRLYLTVHSTAPSQEDETVTEPTTQLLTYNDTASQAEYGVIEDTADIDTADVPDVAAWAAAFFQEHAAPQTQTSADGYEVVKSTGEPFDQFDLGKRCRIPALQVEGPVESIRFDNLLSDPDKARLDLNQKQQSATGRLHSLKEQARAAAASARSAGYAAKKNKSENDKLASYFTKTEREIRLEVYAADSRLGSYISQTATSITQAVYNAESNMASYVMQTASAIRSEVYAADSRLGSYISQTATSITQAVYNAESNMASYVTQTANAIRSEVYAADSRLGSYISQTATNISQSVYNSVSNLQSSISQQADRISLVVEGTGSNAKIKAAQIVAGINNSGSSVIISANHINLDGYVKASDITADFLSAKIAGISSLGVQNLAASGSIAIKENDTYYGIQRSISALNISLSGNTYTLQYKKWDDTTWTDVGSFSRATALSGAWSSGTYTVTASPQGNTESTTLSIISGSNSITSNGTYTYYVMYEDEYGDDQYTGLSKEVTVNVSGGGGGTIDIPTAQIYTTSGSAPSGAVKLTVLKNKFLQAQDDYDIVCFRVDCGSSQKWYWMDPNE